MSPPRSHPSGPIFENSAILKQVLAQHGDKQIWTSPDSARITQRSIYSSPRRALSPQPRLFALLIAINNYKSPNLHHLRGAESDALSFRAYLTTNLNVPQEQTTLLLNEKATRLAIIDAFTKLANDPRIKGGDAIVIYYAGHGGEITPYPGWEAGGPGSKIQMLVPYDYCSVPGHEVPGIPDHTIGALIDHIAMTKGDNITVIFDCCYSASGTRGHSDDILVRSVELEDGVYNPEIDRQILYNGTRGARPAPQFRQGGSKSHVLIAACGSAELAIESNGHGNFSRAFLKLLQTVSPDKLRYSDILTHMDPIPSQNPQCEGTNRNRTLFNAKVLPPSRECYPIRFERDGESSWRLILEAGSAHGITDGAEFMVFLQSDTTLQQQTAVVSVKSTMAFTSLLLFPRGFGFTQPSVAVQTRAGRKEDLRLYVHPQDTFRDLYRSACESKYRSPYCLDNITIVDDPAHAHLGAHVSKTRNKVIFDMKDGSVTSFGFKHQFEAVDANVDMVALVLGRAGHFYRTLNRANNGPGVTSQIHVEFYELQESGHFNECGDPVLSPGLDLCRNGVVDFVVDETAPYGLKMVNNSSLDFYAYLFYFDHSDLSITPYYETSGACGDYKPDVSLKKNGGTLTVGYGSGGVPPFSYHLRKDQDIDVGFIKLFVSTKAIDLSSFRQDTPFSLTRAMHVWAGRPTETWDSILIPVIQRRYPVRSGRGNYSKRGK